MYVGEYGEEGRAAVAALVESGQLEFVGGGWVQPDEAITRFEDMVDQQTLGMVMRPSPGPRVPIFPTTQAHTHARIHACTPHSHRAT